MAERRSSFRFRLPWSQATSPLAPAPANQPSTQPNGSTALSPRTRPQAGSKSAQSTSTTNVTAAETPTSNQQQNPTKNATSGTQNTNQFPNTVISMPSTSSPRPIEPSKTTTTQTAADPTTADSSAETEIPPQPSINHSPRPMSQTSSRPTTPKTSQRPPFRPAGVAPSQSPPPKNQTARNGAQPSTQSQITSQSSSKSPSAFPAAAATNSRMSPSLQSPATTPTSSPTRKASNSPIVKSQIKEKSQAIAKSSQEAREPSSKSIGTPSPVLNKSEPTILTMKEIKSETHSGASASFTDKATQPIEELVQKSTIASDNKRTSQKPYTSDIQETKEVKEVEQGSRVGEKMSGKQAKTNSYNHVPHVPLREDIKNNLSKFAHKTAVRDGNQETGNALVNVINLAGDNRGATMQLGSDSSKKRGSVHINRGYKINPDQSAADATTDGEECSKNGKMEDDKTMAAYVNCNVQGMNNSILFESSITERNPGVNMSMIPCLPSEPVQSSEKKEVLKTHKAEFSAAAPARIIRRRCLRGLFLESSDSDPENPRQRRHGCRVGCKDKAKLTS